MSENEKPLAKTEPVPAGGLKEFLGHFDMNMPGTPENVAMVVEQVNLIDGMMEAMLDVGVIGNGRRFIYLKRSVKHGEWAAFLAEKFPRKSRRTVEWQMLEAKYYDEHAVRRKSAKLRFLNAQGDANFTEEEAAEIGADDLADPTKPAPIPRRDLEKAVSGLTKKVEVLVNRGVKFQDEILELEARLREALNPNEADRQDSERHVMARLAARCVLDISKLGGMLRTSTEEQIEADFEKGAYFASALSSIQRWAVTLVDENGGRLPMNKVEAEIEEDGDEMNTGKRN